MRRSGLVGRLVLAGVVAAIAAGGTSASVVPACTGHDLSGTFSAVPGSAGAGSISYNLRVRNRSTHACFVSGLAGIRLLGRYGRRLPTHVHAAHPGMLTAVRVVVQPGGYAAATARFSPDVPGPGEPVAGHNCEPTAYRARVSIPPSDRGFIVRVRPPTPVCEHGSMVLSVLVAGPHGPSHA